ncbi:MAG: protein kinase family protein, partial [Alphaproteobacteria bacterium]
MSAAGTTVQGVQPQTSGEAGRLAGRYLLDLATPLPHLDTAGGKAFRVRDERDGSLNLYAIVHHPGVPHRRDVLLSLMKSPVSNILNPILQEIIRPQAGGPEQLVTLIEAPAGPSLAEAAARTPVNGHRVRRILVPALVKALTALHARKLTHRALRPENIFFTSDACDEIVLGDCFTSPPGADQPAHFEILERTTAEPFGRGPADEDSDIFAAGASILAAYLGRLPGAERDPEKLHHARVAQGSFWALSAGVEIPGIIGTLLRGMLNDDPDERWTLKEVGAWVDSALPSRRSVTTLWTFARPVTFRRTSYSDRRILAHDFARYPLEAAPFLRGLEFAKWIQQLVTSELFNERLEKLIDVRPEVDLSSSRQGDYALVARVVSHLDPRGPVRFRMLSVCFDGVGPALAEAFREGDEKRLEAFTKLFESGVLPAILDIVAERNPAISRVADELTTAVAMVRAGTMGTGLRRVLYDLNPTLPCLSPQLAGRWIPTPEALLDHIEDHAGREGGQQNLLDPHMLAFFSSRVAQAQRYVDRIGQRKADATRTMSAIVELFAFLQGVLRAGRLPNLCRYLTKGMRPIAAGIRSRTRREATLRRLDQLARSGDIRRLAESVDLSRILQRDAREFANARLQIADLERRRRALRRPVQPDDPPARVAG